MKIIFWGTPDFAVPILQTLHNSNHEVVAVVSQPDKTQGRKKKLISPPTIAYGRENSIPVMQPTKLNKEFRNQLRSYEPDIMIVVAYGRILRQRVLNIPKHGCVNVHFSLLPKYRGASPVNSAILNGDKETGISIMNMVREMDAGPILKQIAITIAEQETTGKILECLGEMAGEPLLEVLENISDITSIPQDENQVSYCGIINKKDGAIDWHKPAKYIERFIYAMSPWPTAYSNLNRVKSEKVDRVIIHSAQVDTIEKSGENGEIVHVSKEHIWVQTSQDVLRINEMQKSGKSILPVKEFLLGTRIEPGDFLN